MEAPRRAIRHPGPPATQRVVAIPVGAVAIDAELPAGLRLLDALAALRAAHAVESAALTLSGGALGPFGFVMPDTSRDGAQVASYSDTRRPPGATRLEAAAVTLGWRDDAPWFHCHGLWTEADGRRGCGHLLPDETVIAAPITARGVGIVGARFETSADPETGFALFVPRATGTMPPASARQAIALRLAPNQDLVAALERAGHAAGFRRALVQGGVASLNQAHFADAAAIAGFATEMLVRHGAIRCVADAGSATTLEAVVVDETGAIGSGRLAAGENPILMTFEGVLVRACGRGRSERMTR